MEIIPTTANFVFLRVPIGHLIKRLIQRHICVCLFHTGGGHSATLHYQHNSRNPHGRELPDNDLVTTAAYISPASTCSMRAYATGHSVVGFRHLSNEIRLDKGSAFLSRCLHFAIDRNSHIDGAKRHH